MTRTNAHRAMITPEGLNNVASHGNGWSMDIAGKIHAVGMECACANAEIAYLTACTIWHNDCYSSHNDGWLQYQMPTA